MLPNMRSMLIQSSFVLHLLVHIYYQALANSLLHDLTLRNQQSISVPNSCVNARLRVWHQFSGCSQANCQS